MSSELLLFQEWAAHQRFTTPEFSGRKNKSWRPRWGSHAVGSFVSVHALPSPTKQSICGDRWMLSNAAHERCWLERDAGCPPSSSQVFVEAHYRTETVPGYRSAKGKRGGGVSSGIVEHSSVGRPGLWGGCIERDSFTKPVSEGFLLLKVRMIGPGGRGWHWSRGRGPKKVLEVTCAILEFSRGYWEPCCSVNKEKQHDLRICDGTWNQKLCCIQTHSRSARTRRCLIFRPGNWCPKRTRLAQGHTARSRAGLRSHRSYVSLLFP